MNRFGPVLMIEDDLDDHEIFQEAFINLGFPNKILFFQDGYQAIEFLQRTEVAPFLIISDINMPRTNGFELWDLIRKNRNLKFHFTPFIFLSTASDEKSVVEAYSRSVQGFFVKGNTLAEIQMTFYVIMKYWLQCASPANYVGSQGVQRTVMNTSQEIDFQLNQE
ncbi:MAG TPA: response regulator [Emticicia sp.]